MNVERFPDGYVSINTPDGHLYLSESEATELLFRLDIELRHPLAAESVES